jgi:hypothetical protein
VTEPGASAGRDAVVGRYSGLARTALAGGTPVDCESDAFADGCFGAFAYTGAAGVPEAALRASLHRHHQHARGWPRSAFRHHPGSPAGFPAHMTIQSAT